MVRLRTPAEYGADSITPPRRPVAPARKWLQVWQPARILSACEPDGPQDPLVSAVGHSASTD